jgi:hypothetical protein
VSADPDGGGVGDSPHSATGISEMENLVPSKSQNVI